ncbi:AAA family ATPase [Rhodococcus qingshengii]|uniref:AAA family ATPase n=1 Tax=Rhodococcus TaxID=1827 RepID=UPI0009EE4F54
MRIKCFRVENFRRLKNARVDLETDRTIFVGANNCGKTSATHLFQMFLRSDGHANPIAFGGNCDIYRCCPVKFRAGDIVSLQSATCGPRITVCGVRGSEMRSYDRCRGHLYVPCFPLTRTQSTKLRLPVQTRVSKNGLFAMHL